MCELFDFECMRKKRQMFICEKILTTSGYANQIYKPYTDCDTLLSDV
jgi:hypothetical protein